MKTKTPSHIEIIFENNFLVVANKPNGTLSVPSRLGAHEKRPILKNLLESQFKCTLWPVHRLDFEVSGLIIYAKQADAHRTLNSWFEKQIIHKTYFAVTEGDESIAKTFSQSTEWRSYLVRGKKRTFEAPYGQEAITLAKFLNRGEQGLEWELHPRTGRSHQLRFELAKHGFPILGDVLYGAQKNKDDAIALQSIAIDFSQCPGREQFDLPLQVHLESGR